MEVRKQWNNVFKVLKENFWQSLHTKSNYPLKMRVK